MQVNLQYKDVNLPIPLRENHLFGTAILGLAAWGYMLLFVIAMLFLEDGRKYLYVDWLINIQFPHLIAADKISATKFLFLLSLLRAGYTAPTCRSFLLIE